MTTPLPQQINRLPKWAKSYIRDLEHERDEANRLLARHVDGQTVSPFYTEEFRSREPEIGDRLSRFYFQANRLMYAEHEGVKLTVCLPRGIQGREGIELSWEVIEGERGFATPVVFQPYSFQAARLFLPSE